MFTATNVKTRGLVQIERNANDGWNCSVLFYGAQTHLTPVVLSSKRIIELFRVIGAPSPASQKDRHTVEFFSGAQLSELAQFGFRLVG
jgi:hypothetical protein